MLVIGIDPGVSGAAALVCSRRGLLAVSSMPTEDRSSDPAGPARNFVDATALIHILRHWATVHQAAYEMLTGVTERISTMGKGNQAYATAVLMHAAGVAEAAISVVTHQPAHLVNPSAWKKDYGLVAKEGLKVPKGASVDMARTIYPNAPRNHNEAEAVLLARWWMCQNTGDPLRQ